MDTLDLDILSSLDSDPRRAYADLARELDVSQPTIADRVRRLETRGILRGSMIKLDFARLGFAINAFVRIKATRHPGRGLIQAARAMPQVVEMYSVTGEDCLIARVATRSVEELGVVLERLSVFGLTSSSVILETMIPLRNPLPQNTEASTKDEPATGKIAKAAAKRAR